MSEMLEMFLFCVRNSTLGSQQLLRRPYTLVEYIVHCYGTTLTPNIPDTSLVLNIALIVMQVVEEIPFLPNPPLELPPSDRLIGSWMLSLYFLFWLFSPRMSNTVQL